MMLDSVVKCAVSGFVRFARTIWATISAKFATDLSVMIATFSARAAIVAYVKAARIFTAANSATLMAPISKMKMKTKMILRPVFLIEPRKSR